MAQFGNILVAGLITGSVYALLALGYSLVFGVSGALNLAQGAFIAVGALVMYTFLNAAHMPIVAAFLAAMAVMLAIVAVIEWVIIRPAITQISHANLLMMLGGVLTAAEGAAFLIWGTNPYNFNPFSGYSSITVGGVSIPPQAFWVFGAMLAAVLLIGYVMSKTGVGRAMRATAENRTAARLMGIHVDRMVLFAFLGAAGLGVVAGAVIAPITSMDYSTMATYTNDGLIAVSLGGLGTVYGSAAGGLLLGVVQSLITGYVSSVFEAVISLALLVLVIVLRPQGLLARRKGARSDVSVRPSGRIYTPPRLPRSWTRSGAFAVVVVMVFMPHLLGGGDLHAVNITGIFCLTLVGLDLLTGVSGMVSLGQAGFMAVGGYMTAILAVHEGFTTLEGLLVGVGGSLIVAAVLGSICSRVRGMYLAIVTLAFGILAESLGNSLSVTGGPSGIGGIPPFSVFGFSFNTDDRFFYLIWILVAVALVLVANLVRSSRGRAFFAMHGDDIGARSLGLSTPRAKVAVFMISAVFASIAGSLYASYFSYLSPSMVGSAESLQLITMLVIGGMGTLFGPLLGVALLTYLPVLSQSFANYSPLATGVLLVLFLRYLPGGLYGQILELANRIRSAVNHSGGRPSAVASLAYAGAPGIGGPVERGDGFNAVATRSAFAVTAAGPSSSWESAASPTLTPVLAIGETNPSGPGVALRVEHLDKTFGGVHAVRDVSFEVDEHTICALIGPNGAGKSTLFNLITNLYVANEGTVSLFGQPLGGMSPDHITRLGLFRTFQSSRIFPHLTVLENVLIGGYRLGRSGYLSQALSLPRSMREERDFHERAHQLLAVLGLDHRADEPASILPLAAQKHLELARALMSDPRMLLLDEPGAGLNDTETAELARTLLAMRAIGHTILLVEHNMSLAMGTADHVVVLDAGRVVARGAPAEVQQDRAVIDAYFGKEQVT